MFHYLFLELDALASYAKDAPLVGAVAIISSITTTIIKNYFSERRSSRSITSKDADVLREALMKERVSVNAENSALRGTVTDLLSKYLEAEKRIVTLTIELKDAQLAIKEMRSEIEHLKKLEESRTA